MIFISTSGQRKLAQYYQIDTIYETNICIWIEHRHRRRKLVIKSLTEIKGRNYNEENEHTEKRNLLGFFSRQMCVILLIHWVVKCWSMPTACFNLKLQLRISCIWIGFFLLLHCFPHHFIHFLSPHNAEITAPTVKKGLSCKSSNNRLPCLLTISASIVSLSFKMYIIERKKPQLRYKFY